MNTIKKTASELKQIIINSIVYFFSSIYFCYKLYCWRNPKLHNQGSDTYVKENTKRNSKSYSDEIRAKWTREEIFVHKHRNEPPHIQKLRLEQYKKEIRRKAAEKSANAAIVKKKNKFFSRCNLENQNGNPNVNFNTSYISFSDEEEVISTEGLSSLFVYAKELVKSMAALAAWPHLSCLIPNFVIIFRTFYTDRVVSLLAFYNIVNFYAPQEASLIVGILILCISNIFPSKSNKLQNQNGPEVNEAKEFLPKHTFISPLSSLITLIVTISSLIFLKSVPSKVDFDSVLNRCGRFDQNIKGIVNLQKSISLIVKDCIDYFSFKILNVESTKISLKNSLSQLHLQISEASTFENQNKLRLDFKQVALIDNLYSQSLLYYNTLEDKSLLESHRVFHNTISNLHRAAISSPARGSKMRVVPMVIQLFGHAGVGKTQLTWPLSVDLIRHMDPTASAQYVNHVYTRKCGEKYWTGYNASRHWITIMDDANQINPNFQESIPFAGEIIHLTNSAECPLPVAEVENKAFAQFNSRVILVTNNKQCPELMSVISDSDAYYRRIDFDIEVSVNPKNGILVNMPSGNSYHRFDPSKLNPDTVNVEKYIFNIYKTGTTEILHSKINYQQLLTLLQNKLDLNNNNHTRFMRNLDTYAARTYTKKKLDLGNNNTTVDFNTQILPIQDDNEPKFIDIEAQQITSVDLHNQSADSVL
jgi:hypothetical protein